MRSLFLSCVGLILLSASPAFSQFVITSSSPADGTVGVPLSTTVSFSFSAPLDTTMRYGELQLPISLIASDPRDSLVFGAISYSPDLQTISFEMTHTANTDFVWLVIGARSNAGGTLSQPYALNYTTSATHGPHAVSGTITYEGGDPANSVVALLDGHVFGEEETAALAGTIVPDSSGMYTVHNVRDGVHWPVVAKDTDGDGEFDPMGTDVMGFYDSDQDGQPDSVVVSGSDLTGVDMALRQLFVPVTARAYVDTATAIAEGYAPDQELRGIGVHADPRGIDVGLDGTATMWGYHFYSPSLQFHTMVLWSSFITMVDTTIQGAPPDARPIPEKFVDSDVAMSVADANGGHDFETHHTIVRRTLYGGDVWFEHPPQDPTRVVWVAEYEAIEPDSSSIIFRVLVDMITGGVTGGVQEPGVSIPCAYFLSGNYPNPFAPRTIIRYSLPQPEKVMLEVFDLLGRKIATLVDEEVDAGEHSVVFDAENVPTGVCFYRIQAGTFVKTKKLVVLR